MKTLITFIITIIIGISTFVQADPIDVNSLKTKFEMAAQEFDAGNYDLAIKLFNETLEIHPQFAHSYNYLGMAYRSKGLELNQVIVYFEKAVEFDPNLAAGYENLGKTYYSLGEFEKAEEACKRALEIDPNMVSVQISLGWIYLIGMGDASEAIEYFEKVTSQESNQPPYAYLGLGIAYYLQGDSHKVLELITSLRKIKYESLALELENLIRNGKQINPNEFGAPLVAKGNKQSTLIKQFPVDLEKKKTALDDGVGGMKVRLREKPLDYDKPDFENMTGSERIRELRNREDAASSIFGEYYGMTGHAF
ncbi:MAG: tetratricopeptide repeat protein [Candidatus Omnitrophica bacterium]|nr:tetratricopeptide repeat protein [Candidatus Omnitrophota bacterium]MBU1996260.1 tetratricopeptide repeat protein [Candidatus Omnitrophota bacterium]MBU4333907.1 tetratricopeptide repeat protein [Candidatus Omnitrophota bacterium]